ncbi:MAG: isoprenylcysteine carboxylmethyltransferase family protein [Myxococcales bacterium]|nr:isoprenylcysteine carboxylmethyltransferase family protein [Myxococcales bacterium]
MVSNLPASLGLYLGLLVLVAFERLAELLISRRNARLAFAQGAVEVGQGHFRVMTIFHTLFLLSCAAEPLLLGRVFPGALGWVALALALAAQALRYWAIATLGPRWNTRIIVLPAVPPVVGGPYRFVKHPNYVAVIVELLALPLVFGGWMTALAFSLGNAALLMVRIRAEEQALGPGYAQAFAGRPRFVPTTAAPEQPRG